MESSHLKGFVTIATTDYNCESQCDCECEGHFLNICVKYFPTVAN